MIFRVFLVPCHGPRDAYGTNLWACLLPSFLIKQQLITAFAHIQGFESRLLRQIQKHRLQAGVFVSVPRKRVLTLLDPGSLVSAANSATTGSESRRRAAGVFVSVPRKRVLTLPDPGSLASDSELRDRRERIPPGSRCFCICA